MGVDILIVPYRHNSEENGRLSELESDWSERSFFFLLLLLFSLFFFLFCFFFLIQFYVPFKIISAHMRWANQ